jgi:hypothetical protein
MEIKNFIKVYDNFIDVNKISSILKWANNNTFEKASIVQGPNSVIIDEKIRKVEALELSNLTENLTMAHWTNYLTNKFLNYLNKYSLDSGLKNECGNNNCNVSGSITLSILKYQDNGHYSYHTDHCGSLPRTISIVCMLNDDYEGGELAFMNPDGSGEELKITKKSGRLIMWPSNFLYPHKVFPVTKGVRYSIVGWLT